MPWIGASGNLSLYYRRECGWGETRWAAYNLALARCYGIAAVVVVDSFVAGGAERVCAAGVGVEAD